MQAEEETPLIDSELLKIYPRAGEKLELQGDHPLEKSNKYVIKRGVPILIQKRCKRH